MSSDILVVDDEEDIRRLIADILTDEGYEVRMASSSLEALDEIARRPPSLIVLDIWLNDSRFDGIEVLDIIKQNHSYLPVVMISGHGNIETAVKTLEKGAYDFIEKPFKTDRLLSVVSKGIETSRMQKELDLLRQTVTSVQFIEKSPKMRRLTATLGKVSSSNSRVLITGEPGTGKEMMARYLHRFSPRTEFPFVVLNCATLKGGDAERILFGEESGTGTLNVKLHLGVLEQAHRGTLYLDGISDLPLETQAKLVRVLQDMRFLRRGGNRPLEVDVRVISSTQVELPQLIQEKRFREDLYYRLNVVPIEMPTLRERQDDVLDLLQMFLQEAAQSARREPKSFDSAALGLLQAYPWPGNVRQLKNLVDWLMIMVPTEDQVITPEHLPGEILGEGKELVSFSDDLSILERNLKEARDAFERRYLLYHFNKAGGKISLMAKNVGMDRTALHRKMKSLDVKVEKEAEAS